MKKAILFRIKEGKKEQWYAWCAELADVLREEAIRTLKEEKVSHELALGFSLENTDYVVGYMEGECLPANMDREINQRHKEMREECLERVRDATVLYDLKREEI